MTAATTVDALRVDLLDHQQSDVRHHGPEGHAQKEVDHERAVHDALAVTHAQVHNGSFICVLVAAQITWLAAVCYAVVWLLS